jgi:geranylgeranyl diphosphate synthase, type II
LIKRGSNDAVSGKNDFFRLYERERKLIDNRLNKLLKCRKPYSLYNPGAYILRGSGKRLRPLLVLLSAKAVGSRFNKVYNAAVAVELLHNFTLVHDDIMDNADKRRGKPTLHIKYDLSTALVVGDSLLSVAYENILKDCNGKTKTVLSSFTKGLIEVCEGQSLDKEFESRQNVSIDEYILMIKKKTAAMAEMCCNIGAILGGGSKAEINSLSKFGRNIGIAFQIQDDLLDITGVEKEFGKKPGGDLIEGKKTYLLLKALEKAKGKDNRDLLRLIRNKGIRNNQVDKYKKLFYKLGVIDEAKKEILKYSAKALSSIRALKNDEDKVIFFHLADTLVKRSK